MLDDDDESDDTDPCPYCRRQIHEDAVRCPYCENYLSREDGPSRQPLWIVITAVLCVVMVLLWIASG